MEVALVYGEEAFVCGAFVVDGHKHLSDLRRNEREMSSVTHWAPGWLSSM